METGELEEESRPSQVELISVSNVASDAIAGDVEGDPGEVDSEATEGSGIGGSMLNFVNSIVGSGIIAFPWALRQTGLWLGVIFILGASIMVDFTTRRLILYGVEIKESRDYQELCYRLWGTRGRNLVAFAMLFYAFGACCAYMIVIADIVPNTIEYIDGVRPIRELVLFFIALLVILPISSLRDMSSLEKTSLISICASAIMSIVIVARAPSAAERTEYFTQDEELVVGIRSEDQPGAYSFAHSGLFHGLGTIFMAFVCQHSSFYVFNSMKASVRKPKDWDKVSHGSLSIAVCIGTLLALGGYLSFLGLSQGDVLTNFPTGDGAINFARLLMSVTMILTYPMELFVCRKILAQFMFPGVMRLSDKQHYGITLVLWVVSLTVGLLFTDLGLLLSLIGTVCASWLGFMIPALIHFTMRPFSASLQVWRSANSQTGVSGPVIEAKVANYHIDGNGGIDGRSKWLFLCTELVWPGIILGTGALTFLVGTSLVIVSAATGHSCRPLQESNSVHFEDCIEYS